MSEELDKRIDATRAKLIEVANQQISYSNYKEKLRAYQELFLCVINVLDDVIVEIDREAKEEEEKE